MLTVLVVLQIVFLILKLCKKIDWHWGWVAAPTWIGLTLIVLEILFVLFLAGAFMALPLEMINVVL